MFKIVLSFLSLLIVMSILSFNSSPDSKNVANDKDSLGSERIVQLTGSEILDLNNFFTSFSEIYLPSFSKDKLPDSVLILFGVYYNYQNHLDMFSQIPKGSKASIHENQVSDTAFKFFGNRIMKHRPLGSIEYNNKRYTILNADGEAYRFSQVRELTDSGDGLFNATIEIYTASSGFTGDINASPDTWNSASNEQEIPQSEGKMKAIIKKIPEQGKSRYILLEYLKL